MKKLKTIIIFFNLLYFFFLFENKITYADDEDTSPGELFIRNHTSSATLKIVVYPIGCVFNGDKDYKLLCKHRVPNYYDYIIGGSKSGIGEQSQMALDHDASGDASPVDGAVGFGLYKIVIYVWNGVYYEAANYCFIDFGTSDYPFYGHPYLYGDIGFEYRNNNIITHNGGYTLPEDRTIKAWDQRQWRGENAYEPPNKNGFKTAPNDQYGNWLNFPQIATDYGGTAHETPDTQASRNASKAWMGWAARCSTASPTRRAELGAGLGFQSVGRHGRHVCCRIEEHRDQLRAGDAVDHAVVGLGDEREAGRSRAPRRTTSPRAASRGRAAGT